MPFNQNQQTEYNTEATNNAGIKTWKKVIDRFLLFIIMPLLALGTVLLSVASIGLAAGSLVAGLISFAVGAFEMWVVFVIHQFLVEGAKRQVIFSFLAILLAFFVLFILSLFFPLDLKIFIVMPFWAIGLLFSIIPSLLLP